MIRFFEHSSVRSEADDASKLVKFFESRNSRVVDDIPGFHANAGGGERASELV